MFAKSKNKKKSKERNSMNKSLYFQFLNQLNILIFMKKINLLFASFLILFLYSCQRDDSFPNQEKKNEKISKAEVWFTNYLSRPVDEIFSNARFQ